MTKLEILKECFQIRGELQNGSITGVNSDEKNLMLKNINRVIKEIADYHPPFLQTTFNLHLQSKVPLTSGTTNTATGSINVPKIIDSASVLSNKHVHWMLSNGTQRRRIIDVSSGTYTLDAGLFAAATTATTWIAYKDALPCPHNMGHIHRVFYEDGDDPVTLVPRVEYEEMARRHETTSNPYHCSINAFSHRWGNYKYAESSVTVTNGSNIIKVADNTYYDFGDVMNLGTAGTYYLHTITGIPTATTQVYIDRNFSGSQSSATLILNPLEFTNYLSFYSVPSTAKEVKIVGYIQPQDMVGDDEICIIPDNLCPAVIAGALLRDDIGKRKLTEQWANWYQRTIQILRTKKDAVVFKNIRPPDGFFSGRRRANYYDWSRTGLS